MSSRFGMVDGSGLSSIGHLPSSGQPLPRLLVRRLGRGMGCSSSGCNLFRPLVSGGGSSVYQREGAPCGGIRPPASPAPGVQLHGGSVCGQFDSSGLSPQTRGHPISSPQLHCSEDPLLGRVDRLVLVPQFIQGKNNVLADSLSRPNQVQGSEWTLKWEVFRELNNKWPVMIDLFATSLNHRCSHYFSPFHDPPAIGTDTLLQNWDGYQVYAFPPWSMIPLVLKKLRLSSGVLMTLVAPFWPQRPWFPDLLEPVVDGPISLPQCRDLLSQPRFHCHHLGIDKLSLHAWRLSSDLLDLRDSPLRVVKQLGFARRSSSRAVYQSKWLVYRGWCRGAGHSISRPTLPKIADFLLWLHRTRKLSVSAIIGYRSMLSAVFRFKLLEISTSPALQDLLRSFQVAAPSRSIQPPSWDLNKVLFYLRSSAFEPLQSASLRALPKKTLFLMSLATAKRVSELRALSSIVSFSSEGAVVSYVPEFLAKTESAL